MKKINYLSAEKLSGPRIYFTLLDENNIGSDWDKYKDDIEDIIKVLLLTKESMVMAASHLVSDKALDFFKDKEILFEKKLILPALRSEYKTFDELFESKNKNNTINSDINNFFSNQIREVVPWDLKENSGWFQKQIEKTICDNNSVIMKNLEKLNYSSKFKNVVESEINQIKLSNKGYLDRGTLDKRIKVEFSGKALEFINKYIDLLYYVSGSRVVNCETNIPQENLLSYNLAAMEYNKEILNERKVFKAIVFNLIISNMYENSFNLDLLRNISIKEIIELRELNSSLSKNFRKKYEETLLIGERFVHNDEKDLIISDIEELMGLTEEIRNSFDNTIKKELKGLKKLNVISSKSSFTGSLIDLTMNVVGVTFLPLNLINFLWNNLSKKNTPTLLQQKEKINKACEYELQKIIGKIYSSDPVITKYLNEIVQKHRENYLKSKD